MKKEAIRYFQKLFAENLSTGEYSRLPQLFQKLNTSDIVNIQALVSEKEVKHCTFDIGGLKAPGPDGFPAIFF